MTAFRSIYTIIVVKDCAFFGRPQIADASPNTVLTLADDEGLGPASQTEIRCEPGEMRLNGVRGE